MAGDKVIMGQKSGKGAKSTVTATVSAKGLPEETYVVGLWKQDSPQIVGHSNVSRGAADPSFTTTFVMDSFSEDATEVKFCMYTVQPKNTVTEDCFVGCAIFKLADLKDGYSAPLEGKHAGASLVFKATVSASKKKEKKDKGAAKPQEKKMTKAEKEEAKLQKLAFKEGGKKGQDLCGMSTFGVHHFMPAMESPAGRWDLMELCMQGMNKKVDPDADDRKGGAGDLGKLLFNACDDKLIMYCHVPTEVASKGASMSEWMEAVCKPSGATITPVDEFFCKAEVAGDADAGKFPLKMRDEAIAAGFQFLREKGLILDDDDSDDDINFADDCGIDLNAGAEGDY